MTNETEQRLGFSAGGRGVTMHVIVVPKGMNSGHLLCRPSSRGVAHARFKDSPLLLTLRLNLGCSRCAHKLDAQ